jgi:hypothetical protein
MDPIKESSAIVGSAIIYSIGLYPVRDIVIYKEDRFVERRVVCKIGDL